MKGFTFADWAPFNLPAPPPPPPGRTPPPARGLYPPAAADTSLENLAATGANWIGLIVVAGQETIASTEIIRDSSATATDAELQHVIDQAHGLGMRVMLRPQLQLYDFPEHWSGQIGTAFTLETQWQEWFTSYRDFMDHYAAFAQKTGVDMLCIGVELGSTTHRSKDWRLVIQEVRERFAGPITYSSLCTPFAAASFPHGEENRINWWDAVDYIGVSAYYNLTDKNDPTVAEIRSAWTKKGHIALLENLAKRFNKPIVFTEIGYESEDGANRWPGWGQRGAPLDLQEQADCYQATLEVMMAKPWLAGIFWFQWFARPAVGGPDDTGYTPFGKPAEAVLQKFYLNQ